MALILTMQPGIVLLAHAVVRPFLGLVAGAMALFLTIRSVQAFVDPGASGLAAISLAIAAAAFWVAGVALFAGPIAAIVLGFALIAGGAGLCAYWFPSARPYWVGLAFLSALFVCLLATGLWLPLGAAIGDIWSTV